LKISAVFDVGVVKVAAPAACVVAQLDGHRRGEAERRHVQALAAALQADIGESDAPRSSVAEKIPLAVTQRLVKR
jgi:hypothetical protein